MINFRAKMYNVTSGEYYDSTPTDYSFAEYFGYTYTEEASFSGNPFIDWWLNGGLNQYFEPVAVDDPSAVDALFGHSGETLTIIPYTRFTFKRSTNVGTWFEYYAKKYYDENSSWPILRLLKTNDTDSYYLEWSHSFPLGFNIKSDGGVSRWEWCFQWDDAFNSQYTDDRKYNLLFSTVFVNSSIITDLVNPRFLKYSGAFCYNNTTGSLDTLVGSQVYTVSVNPDFMIGGHEVYCTANLKRSQSAGNRNRYYTSNGLADEIAIALVSVSSNWLTPVIFAPAVSNSAIEPYTLRNAFYGDYSGSGTPHFFEYGGISWGYCGSGGPVDLSDFRYTTYESLVPIYDQTTSSFDPVAVMEWVNPIIASNSEFLYYYLLGEFVPIVPPSDVDPEDIPPADEYPEPIPPDSQDPYYDPESDPRSPTYDPVKDPKSPSYDPSVPATPYQPIIQQTILEYPAPIINPPDPIPAPETPATYVNTSRLFTIFTPTVSQLTDFANFLWASPTDIVPTFRKIVANPMDCVLGLMVIPQLSFTRQSRELNIGNIGTGITMDYAPSQFVDFDCGQLFLQEYYRSYLDYSPYTKVDIFLPFIGTRELSIDECMQKTIGVTYRFDLATGTCVAFIKVNGTVLYQFEGNCASHIPLSSADWGSTVKAIPTIAAGAIKAGGLIGGGPIGTLGVAAAASVMSMKERHPHAGSMSGSAGLMGVLYPYLIVTRPCQALPESQNSFTGYPSFITLSLGDCSGYTEVEQVHLEHVPATGEELVEIERLLKAGVLF